MQIRPNKVPSGKSAQQSASPYFLMGKEMFGFIP